MSMKPLSKRACALALCAFMGALALAGCGGKAPANEAAAPEAPAALTAQLDQYYANEDYMVEMLVNSGCIVTENEASLTVTTPEEHAAITLTLLPGIQNLAAAAEIASSVVSNTFPDVAVGEQRDGYLFGARAKNFDFSFVDGDGKTTMGIEGAAIVNQSCYMMNVMFLEGMSETEGELMVNVFSSMNVLQPTQVDAEAKTAAYASHYEEQVDAGAVKPAPQSKARPASEWSSLPYAFYSWWGDPGDYGDYPPWYFEPDWNYYGDPAAYWTWGWDDGGDWWFYDQYGDYYGYDYYAGYDYYEYDPWSDPYEGWGDVIEEDDGYEVYSDPGDGDDEWSDPGDGYDDGYEVYSDPGDGYDEWSDPGDGYDEW